MLLVGLALAAGLSYGIVEDDNDWAAVCQVFAAVLLIASLFSVRVAAPDRDRRFARDLGRVAGAIMISMVIVGLLMRRSFFGDWNNYGRLEADFAAIEPNTPNLVLRLCLLCTLWFVVPAQRVRSRMPVAVAVVIVGAIAAYGKAIHNSTLAGLVAIAIEGIHMRWPADMVPAGEWYPPGKRWWAHVVAIFAPIGLATIAAASFALRLDWSNWTTLARRLWWAAYGPIVAGLAVFAVVWRTTTFPDLFPEYAETARGVFSREGFGAIAIVVVAAIWFATGASRRLVVLPADAQENAGHLLGLVGCLTALIGAIVWIVMLFYVTWRDWGLGPYVIAYYCTDSGFLLQLGVMLLSATGIYRIATYGKGDRYGALVARGDFLEALAAILLVFAAATPALTMVGVCWWTAPFN